MNLNFTLSGLEKLPNLPKSAVSCVTLGDFCTIVQCAIFEELLTGVEERKLFVLLADFKLEYLV